MDEPKPNPDAESAREPDGHGSDDGHEGHGPPAGEPKRWLDYPQNVTRIFYALCAICLVLAGVDIVHAYHKHVHFSFEEIPAFNAGFGFLAYVGLVLTAIQLRKLIKRPEDYYD